MHDDLIIKNVAMYKSQNLILTNLCFQNEIKYIDYFQLSSKVACEKHYKVGSSDSIFNPEICTCLRQIALDAEDCDKKVCESRFNLEWDRIFQDQICVRDDDVENPPQSSTTIKGN